VLHRSAVLFLALAAPVRSGPPEETLARALARLRAAAGNLTRYAYQNRRATVLSAVRWWPHNRTGDARTSRPPRGTANWREWNIDTPDRLSLEVTLSDGGEIYSWPGACDFNQTVSRRLHTRF
jgi:hypothetical protein